jgi:hypothetical protein
MGAVREILSANYQFKATLILLKLSFTYSWLLLLGSGNTCTTRQKQAH